MSFVSQLVGPAGNSTECAKSTRSISRGILMSPRAGEKQGRQDSGTDIRREATDADTMTSRLEDGLPKQGRDLRDSFSGDRGTASPMARKNPTPVESQHVIRTRKRSTAYLNPQPYPGSEPRVCPCGERR